jgi:hypothetical protein
MPVITTPANERLIARLHAVSQVTGVPMSTVNRIAGFVRMSTAEDMYDDGLPTRTIGRYLGVSHTTVENWLKSLRGARKEANASELDLRGSLRRRSHAGSLRINTDSDTGRSRANHHPRRSLDENRYQIDT